MKYAQRASAAADVFCCRKEAMIKSDDRHSIVTAFYHFGSIFMLDPETVAGENIKVTVMDYSF